MMIFAGQFDPSLEIETLEFDVPLANVQNINFLIHDCPFEHVFVLLKDPQKQLRALWTFKTRIKSYFVGQKPENCSNGALSGSIEDGIWSLVIVKPSITVIGRFQVEIRTDNKLQKLNYHDLNVLEQDFTQTRMVPNDRGRLIGDLHLHSYYSDGRESLEEISGYATAKKMGFLALTDHSIVTTEFPDGEYLLIPATEITTDNQGHYNAFGLKKLIDYSRYFIHKGSKTVALDGLFSDLVKQNVLLSINHPFAEGISGTHEFDLCYFECIEVINAPHLVDEFIDNEKAIRFFDFLWSQGHFLYGVGGSDSHKKSDHGLYPILKPTNQLHTKISSIDGVLHALRKGHNLILSGVNATIHLIDNDGNTLLPGQQVEGKVVITGSISELVSWRVIENRQCIYQFTGTTFEFTANIVENVVLRVEARIEDKTVLFMNPIFGKRSNPARTSSFQILLQQFNEEEKALWKRS